jgi:hypothetical protein
MIKEIKRALLNRGSMHIVFCLCGIVLINLLALPCFGLGTVYSEPVFSLTSSNEPLSKALDKISKATGYKIAITNGWGNKSLTADLQDLTLDEGLERIIKAIGNPNHAIQRNDRTKKVEIKILDTVKGSSSSASTLTKSYAQLQQKQTEAVLNSMDSTPQEQSDTTTADANSKVDPLDLEVIPPEVKGGKGVTEREITTIKKVEKEEEPSASEIIPPDSPRP